MDKHGLSGLEVLPLQRRSDDFSEQFSLPGDPKFWIRYELPLGTPLIVTDFFPGALDTYQMAAAFLQSLAMIDQGRAERIIFRNLGDPSDPDTQDALQEHFRVLDAVVSRQRRFVIGRETHVRRGKLDLEVEFKSFA